MTPTTFFAHPADAEQLADADARRKSPALNDTAAHTPAAPPADDHQRVADTLARVRDHALTFGTTPDQAAALNAVADAADRQGAPADLTAQLRDALNSQAAQAKPQCDALDGQCHNHDGGMHNGPTTTVNLGDDPNDPIPFEARVIQHDAEPGYGKEQEIWVGIGTAGLQLKTEADVARLQGRLAEAQAVVGEAGQQLAALTAEPPALTAQHTDLARRLYQAVLDGVTIPAPGREYDLIEAFIANGRENRTVLAVHSGGYGDAIELDLTGTDRLIAEFETFLPKLRIMRDALAAAEPTPITIEETPLDPGVPMMWRRCTGGRARLAWDPAQTTRAAVEAILLTEFGPYVETPAANAEGVR